MFRAYEIIMEDRDSVYKVVVPATNEKEAAKYVEGNGDVVRVKEITDDYPISTEKVVEALKAASFGKVEIDLITRLVLEYRNTI